jgi:hypothetical protein
LKNDDFTCKPVEVDQGSTKQLTILKKQKQKTCKSGTKS